MLSILAKIADIIIVIWIAAWLILTLADIRDTNRAILAELRAPVCVTDQQCYDYCMAHNLGDCE